MCGWIVRTSLWCHWNDGAMLVFRESSLNIMISILLRFVNHHNSARTKYIYIYVCIDVYIYIYVYVYIYICIYIYIYVCIYIYIYRYICIHIVYIMTFLREVPMSSGGRCLVQAVCPLQPWFNEGRRAAVPGGAGWTGWHVTCEGGGLHGL